VLSQLLEHRRVSIYQDVIEDGRTIRVGRRDCVERWRAIVPYLPSSGVMLDVGSNFGWFGLKACAAVPGLVVASVEADEETAAIARHVLQSHRHQRIVLLTRRASAPMARDFAAAGQRFDAVLCLAVLHWMPDHERFLRILGEISAKIFVELPDPDETGAGLPLLRRQIGTAGEYLRRLFPDRRCVRLAQIASHRDATRLREIWLAERTEASEPAPGLEVSALLRSSVSWPPRSWWREQLGQVELDRRTKRHEAGLIFAPGGLVAVPAADAGASLSSRRLQRQIAALPEQRLLSHRDWLARRIRRLGKAAISLSRYAAGRGSG
jgi:hypothetical protein